MQHALGGPNENTLYEGQSRPIKSATSVSGDDFWFKYYVGWLASYWQPTILNEDFIMDTEDGYGVLEIMFGDVSGLANGHTLFKIETTNYRKFTDAHDSNWGDTEFKVNSSGQMYIHSNGGSNNVIKVQTGGYPSAGIYFIMLVEQRVKTLGFSTNLGRFGSQGDYNKAVEAAQAVQLWNDANDNYNNAPGGLPGGTSGLINDHYYARGDSLLGLFRNNRELEEYNIGGLNYFSTWKGGPEFLNASPSTSGGWSISSNDHFMIHVDDNSWSVKTAI